MTTLSELIATRRVLVCVGSGGVGKTTTSAIIGLHAALRGRRVLVMTIDPARRLANSLGIEGLDHEIQQIDLSAYDDLGREPGGALWATMLDMKSAFDSIVDRHIKDPAERKAIDSNRFYRFFSTSLAGAQEMSATDRLLDVIDSGQFDLVVLDTPPTTNALDFLDAPSRFAEALDSETIRWFIEAGGRATRGGKLLNVGTGMVVRTLGKFTGTEFFTELGDFLYHLNSVLTGFNERSRLTRSLLSDASSAFVIVTSPDPSTAREAAWFRKRLAEFNVRLGALVVNRVRRPLAHEGLLAAPVNVITDRLLAISGADLIGRPLLTRIAGHLLTNATQFNELARRDAATIDDLRREIGADVHVATVPMYAADIHSLSGLERVRRDLFDLARLDDEDLQRLARTA